MSTSFHVQFTTLGEQIFSFSLVDNSMQNTFSTKKQTKSIFFSKKGKKKSTETEMQFVTYTEASNRTK